jgi:DNA-directed RNA polymerase subunit RPC12/RpoP
MEDKYIHCRLCSYKVPKLFKRRADGKTVCGWDRLEYHYKQNHEGVWNKIKKDSEGTLKDRMRKIENVNV